MTEGHESIREARLDGLAAAGSADERVTATHRQSRYRLGVLGGNGWSARPSRWSGC